MSLHHCRCHRQIQERSGTCMATTCQIVAGSLGARSLAFWLFLALIPLFFFLARARDWQQCGEGFENVLVLLPQQS